MSRRTFSLLRTQPYKPAFFIDSALFGAPIKTLLGPVATLFSSANVIGDGVDTTGCETGKSGNRCPVRSLGWLPNQFTCIKLTGLFIKVI